ncbi:MAG: PD-(D/E)XK nuclease domain-containing protein [Clostridia bacterium]|nr:PD-(D/E)XK nuclease domain-containing protein [Clostridia bacterium]
MRSLSPTGKSWTNSDPLQIHRNISTFKSFETSLDLLKATWNEDADKVAALLEAAHNQAGNKTYHDEAALSYAIQFAYYAAQKYYTVILELDSGKGYADIACLPAPAYPDKPALLIELKVDQVVDSALAQIKRQQYPSRLEHYKGNILLVGISYDRESKSTDPKFKHHTCRIERA